MVYFDDDALVPNDPKPFILPANKEDDGSPFLPPTVAVELLLALALLFVVVLLL